MQFIQRLLTPISRLIDLGKQAHPGQQILFDSPQAAQESAFMLSGQWDGCNGVVVNQLDQVALSTVAKLVGAKWCYSGTRSALLPRLSAEELISRRAAGEQNFVNANLRGTSLKAVDLSQVNLNWAKLNGAVLAGANLSRANLSKADLHSADLREANLEAADFSGANLSQANLRGANLRGANLRAAEISEAELTDAILSGAIMPNGKVQD